MGSGLAGKKPGLSHLKKRSAGKKQRQRDTEQKVDSMEANISKSQRNRLWGKATCAKVTWEWGDRDPGERQRKRNQKSLSRRPLANHGTQRKNPVHQESLR